MYEGNCDWIS